MSRHGFIKAIITPVGESKPSEAEKEPASPSPTAARIADASLVSSRASGFSIEKDGLVVPELQEQAGDTRGGFAASATRLRRWQFSTSPITKQRTSSTMRAEMHAGDAKRLKKREVQAEMSQGS